MILYIFDLDNTLIHINNIQINNSSLYRQIIKPNNKLSYYLSLITTPKYIFSNASHNHVLYSLDALQLLNSFTKIYSYTNLGVYKPTQLSYFKVQNDISNQINRQTFQIIFFDDLIENLIGAKQFNWTTVLIGDYRTIGYNHIYIDYCFLKTEDALEYFYKTMSTF